MAAVQGYRSACRRAAARRSSRGRSASSSIASAYQSPPSPGTATPASPTTSGNALSALTATGVPLASASRAARPKVSTGPGATTTSAVASSRAIRSRSLTWSSNRTGRPARRAATRIRAWRGPPPTITPTAARPRFRSAASAASTRSGRFSGESRPQCSTRISRSSAYRARSAGSYRSGWNRVRSTPSGTCVTLRAPRRRNSLAAQAVVQSTRSYSAAVRALSRSVNRSISWPAHG